MVEIKYKPIGVIHSPFKEPKGTPIQPTASQSKGTVEIFPEFSDGLQDLEKFSHIILIYHFHLSKKSSLKMKPFMDDTEHGIFSIRAPSRPNSIGMSIVRLNKIEKNILYVENIDILEGTPLIDIKPFVPEFDNRNTTENGWLKNNVYKLKNTKDDERFVK
ncbi:MAG: tRNA (N6-threonylcarbamoyladenosine(37)-N6)-methyltransferase TrmO [Bacteroidales bacterium]|nr:tRNA (N6-threonylcarbamoyladenosine(37)-N6)-methyltransferase TrmO [Bacteroidales bacterium]